MLNIAHDLELEESEWISIYKAFSAASHAHRKSSIVIG
jgi:hypothetical protein